MRSVFKGAILLISVSFLISYCSKSMSVDELQYELVWSDEFNGTAIDNETWNFWIGTSYNYELQIYTDREKNAFIEDGMLHLQAHRENYRGRKYTSARISTDSTHIGWNKGRFEARLKMPKGTGFWPAFWLLPMGEPGWPKGGEIDIMEFQSNKPYTITGAVHFWMNGCEGFTSQCLNYYADSHTVSGTKLSDDFHVYALDWTDNELTWFLDDIVYQQIRFDDIDADSDPFSKPFYIILNLAVGGTFVDNPDRTTEFPQSLIVDYVRVYQLN